MAQVPTDKECIDFTLWTGNNIIKGARFLDREFDGAKLL